MLISENTFRALAEPGAYGIRRVGRVQVVGKLAPVTIYEVIDGDPEPLRAQKAAIDDGVGPEELARRFAAFTARDPVLPPELAALRQKAKTAAGDAK